MTAATDFSEELEALIAEQARDMRYGDRVFSVSLDAQRDGGEGEMEGLSAFVVADDSGQAVLLNQQRRSFKRPLSASDPRHGTVNGYGNLACRCDSCKAAWAAYCLQAKQRRRLGIPGRGAVVPEHGTLTRYQNWACRCELCGQARYENALRRGKVKGQRRPRLLQRFVKAVATTSRSEALEGDLRIHHVYREPVRGMCQGLINLGSWDSVRCSFRASIGDYCATHARKIGLITAPDRCEAHLIDGRQCRNKAKTIRGESRVCLSHARFMDRASSLLAEAVT